MQQHFCKSVSGRLGLFENLGGVVLGVHLGDDVGDGALLIYDVGLAQGAHADLAVVLLLAPGLVGLQDDRVRIGYQGEGQGVFFYEFPVRGHAVLADSHHGVALALSLRLQASAVQPGVLSLG